MVSPMKIRNKEKRRIELARQSNIPIYSQQFVDKLDSELSALRSQVAELQHNLDEALKIINIRTGQVAELQRQLEQARAEERELCAQVCEVPFLLNRDAAGTARNLADAIRARGEKI